MCSSTRWQDDRDRSHAFRAVSCAHSRPRLDMPFRAVLAQPFSCRQEVGLMNRKLIRPDLSDLNTLTSKTRVRKPPPPEQTNAENYYYSKQMSNKTRMVILLKDGEEIRGVIEW